MGTFMNPALSSKTDARKMDHRRLTSAVVIHAAAFLVAVVSLGSGSGIGASASADSKIDRVERKQPVQAFGLESRLANQALRARQDEPAFAEENADATGTIEAFAPVASPGDGVIAVQFQPSR